MSAHTPGPWQVEEGFSVVGTHRTVTEYFVRRDGDSIAIAADVLDPATGEPSEANARLIAQAPVLFAACEVALGHSTHRGQCVFCGASVNGEHVEWCPTIPLRAALRTAKEPTP